MGWCSLCPGQVMPPLPPVKFKCPKCPTDTVCGPCAPGDPIAPDATTYIALGAPASCPVCPDFSPDKAQMEVIHEDDVAQMPADMKNAHTLAHQNQHNVTVHVKHHHKAHRPGAWTRELNVTFTSSETTSTANVSTSSSTTSDASTTTTTTTDYSAVGDQDYDYTVVDYVTTTTTTEDGGRHHHRKKVKLLPEEGKRRQHNNKDKNAPAQTSTTPLPGGITEKKTRVPGLPPGQPKPIGGQQVTVTDASPIIHHETQIIANASMHGGSGNSMYNMSGRVEVRAIAYDCGARDAG